MLPSDVIVLWNDAILNGAEQNDAARICKCAACFRRSAGKLVIVSAESIFNKPRGKRQKAVLGRIAAQQAVGDDSRIDYSDIPQLTDQQTVGVPPVPQGARGGSRGPRRV
jgi:hypothetical protein